MAGNEPSFEMLISQSQHIHFSNLLPTKNKHDENLISGNLDLACNPVTPPPPPVCHHLPPSLPGELCTGQAWSSPVILHTPPPPHPGVSSFTSSSSRRALYWADMELACHSAPPPPTPVCHHLPPPLPGELYTGQTWSSPVILHPPLPRVSSFTSFSSRRALYWADMELACNSAASHCSRSSMMTS